MVGKPKLQQFSFYPRDQVLVCISYGGPATTVVWSRNEMELHTDGTVYKQIQTIANKTESIYTSTLNIRKLDPVDVAGNYTCNVSNSRGHFIQRLEILGVLFIVKFLTSKLLR